MSETYDHTMIKWVWVEGISGITSNTAYRIACDLCGVPIHPELVDCSVGGKYLFSNLEGGDRWYRRDYVPENDKILMRIDNDGNTYEFYRAQYPEWTEWSYYVAPMNEDEQFRMNDGVVEFRVKKDV